MDGSNPRVACAHRVQSGTCSTTTPDYCASCGYWVSGESESFTALWILHVDEAPFPLSEAAQRRLAVEDPRCIGKDGTCENEARYFARRSHVRPFLCGVCDTVENGGKGESGLTREERLAAERAQHAWTLALATNLAGALFAAEAVRLGYGHRKCNAEHVKREEVWGYDG